MAETNVINEVTEVIEEATEVIENVTEIPVTVVKSSSKTSKVVLCVALVGIATGAVVGVTKVLKKRKADKEISEIADDIEVTDLTKDIEEDFNAKD